ncbi:MAG TPA: carboxypeptidase-like regulatory domain-containing protein [Thermoanaerobaculia bacterium]|nr:carboxypeptidase-like regulatory domain-containing protein [Thermoanaerobaculia bacterium]
MGSSGVSTERGRPVLAATLAAWFLLPVGAGGVAPSDQLSLVDDRGEPLGSPVEICLVQGLETDCVERSSQEGPVELPPFDLLRVEGADHGPVTVRPARLRSAGENGPSRLVVPRKATLRARGAAEHRLTAALYPVADPDPLRPAHSLAVPASGELKVPAGDWLLALEGRGAAPDLHLLAAAPGTGHDVRYRAREGWSLALRVVAKDGGEPVAGARVVIQAAGSREPEGPGARGERRTAETGPHGLVLLSGLQSPLMEALVDHPAFVETTLPGLSSTLGALEFWDAPLGRGAALEATIRVDGEPARGWRCALLDRPPGTTGSSREVRAMAAGNDGACLGERLPEGSFWLRVTAPEGSGAAEREIQLYDGEASGLAFDLSPIPVEGEVLEGEEPAAAYTIRIFRTSETGSTYFVEPVAETVSAEDGTYETTVWDAGHHYFSLTDPQGEAASSEHADVQGPVTRVDFRLAPGEIEGLVVDEDGEPVAGAMVMVKWDAGTESSGRGLWSGDDGTFRLALESAAGTLTVTASHAELRPETVRLTLVEGEAPPPIVLTLRRGGALQGRLLTAAGAPVVGAMVMSFEPGPGGGLARRGSTRTDGEGGFEVPSAAQASTRIFAGGPGCPLTLADVTEAASEPVVITCPGASGTLLVHLRDEQGRPVSGELVLLRRGDVVIPQSVLAAHLHFLGQSMTSDGSGRLVLPGLTPGTYAVYLYGRTSEDWVGQGLPQGHAGSVTVAPEQTLELEVLVENDP